NAIPGYEDTAALPPQILCQPFPHRPQLRPDSLHRHPLSRDVHRGSSRAEAELRVRAFLLGRDGTTMPGLEGCDRLRAMTRASDSVAPRGAGCAAPTPDSP